MMQSQKGISYWGVVLAIGFFGLAIKVASTVGPIYLDNMTLSKMVSSTFKEPNVDGMSIRDLQDSLTKGLQMNNLSERKIDDLMRIYKEGNTYVIDLQYEERRNLIANLDVVVSFNKSFSSEHPDGVEIAPAEGQNETK